MFSGMVSIVLKRVLGRHDGERLTQALSGGTLEEVVDGSADNNALAAGVDGESTDLNAVAASNILDERGLANDLNELLASVTVLVEVADITRSHLLLQRDADGVLQKAVSPDTVEARIQTLTEIPWNQTATWGMKAIGVPS
jgi:hypothetical protein